MDLKGLEAVAKTIRALSIDAIEKANSGHPGLPMGCAEIGAYLFGEVLNINPKDTSWFGRDRFILSAGHGSMLLYSLMHLAGYEDVTIDEIKKFRQLKSKTPGHPEYGWTDGVETSTGPLGQGFANSVGMAIAGKRHAARFNKEGFELFSGRIFTLVGDGDLMEGISYEAGSIAGHLALNNLIAIYDSNRISIEGPVDITLSESVRKRFEAFNWHVIDVDGHSLDSIKRGFDEAEIARIKHNRPVLIIADTIIGKGSPNKEDSNTCHGAPLGKDELEKTKKNLGITSDFFVDPAAVDYFGKKMAEKRNKYDSWKSMFNEWKGKYPELNELFNKNFARDIDASAFQNLPAFAPNSMHSTREASNKVLNAICKDIDFVVSGSADLACSTMTVIKESGDISSKNFLAHNIQYGVREHAMGAIANGLYLYGGVLPIVGTFLSFVNYMRPTLRMAALMRIPTIFLYSHDSIYVGEDGPSHHPIEHISELRLIPNMNVMRPCDPEETKIAWELALTSKHTPSTIITTRQKVRTLDYSKLESYTNAKRGGYILKRESKKDKIDMIFIATGSEVSLVLDVAEKLESEGYSIRVVNMFSTYLFDHESAEYRESVLPSNIEKRVAVEAGVSMTWYKYVGLKGDVIGIDKFGISGKAEDVGVFFKFTNEDVYNRVKIVLNK